MNIVQQGVQLTCSQDVLVTSVEDPLSGAETIVSDSTHLEVSYRRRGTFGRHRAARVTGSWEGKQTG